MFQWGYSKTQINLNKNYIKRTKMQTKTIRSNTNWDEKHTSRRPQNKHRDETHEVAHA